MEALIFAVEAWLFETPEEPLPADEFTEPFETAEFHNADEAKEWCWAKMHEGYQTRLWVR